MWATIRKLLFLLSRREKNRLLIVLAGMLLMGFLEVLGVGSILPFISVASDPSSIHENEYLSWAYSYFGFTSNTRFLFVLGVAVVVFIVVSNVSRAMVSWAVKRYSSMRQHSLGVRLLQRYLERPYVFFLNQNTSILAKNILNEVTAVVRKFLLPLLELATRVVIALSIILLLFLVEPVLALLVSAVLASAYFVVFVAIRRALGRLGKRRIEANSRRFKHATEAMGGIKDIKLLGRERTFLTAFEKPSKVLARAEASSEIMGELPKYLLETIAFGGILLIVLYLIQTGGDFSRILPVVSLYAFAGYRLMPALQVIFRSLTKMKYSTALVEALYEDMEGWKGSASVHHDGAIVPLPYKDRLELKDVGFRYPGAAGLVINHQSLSIRKNTTVGFVGPTGCGKTTLIDIILGLLIPETGSIEVDGTRITDANRRNWQANLGYVPQHIYLTDDSIAMNIAFGVSADEVDMAAVRKAARIANLDSFVETELADGYETLVGERGVRLSGGQRQRIGIARAIYHDPDTLILDEATSALDNVTEQAIMEAIENLSHKKTILMIAHRLSTVKECDVIYVMDHGRIVDSGDYDALLMRNEHFRKLAQGIR